MPSLSLKAESWGNAFRVSTSLRASSPVWASETGLARMRERAAKPRGALARSREARFACPNRRACSQARYLLVPLWASL